MNEPFDCLVLDLLLPGKGGMQVLGDLRSAGKTLRVFEVLEYLMRHKNETVTRAMLGRDVWKEPGFALTNVIDVYINSVRRKLERIGKRSLIQTVRGVGYMLLEESEVTEDEE